MDLPLVNIQMEVETATVSRVADQIGPGKASETEDWRTRPQLSLLIENIPTHWMVGDLKTFLDGFGNVVKAEIFEDRLVRLSFRIT
jgi:hypothetical protein